MGLSARLLEPGDEEIVDRFLEPHTPFAFFMRSNLKQGGIRYQGQPFQADYFGAFNGPHLVGVLTHSWRRSVQVFAADRAAIPLLAREWLGYRARRPRLVECVIGPFEDGRALLSACRVEDSSLHDGGVESGLYSLSLNKIVRPDVLNRSGVSVRRAEVSEAELLIQWRHDFNVEANGASPGSKVIAEARKEITRRIEDKDLFVLKDGNEIVSFCGAGGYLSDWTMVAPVWTPPEKRGRCYAKGVVAGALAIMRQEGLTNAVLFASRPDALKVYGDIGFTKTGRWLFDTFKKPFDKKPI